MKQLNDFGTFKFIREVDLQKIEMTMNGQATLMEMIEMFENFLRASGYHFEGHIDIVESEL